MRFLVDTSVWSLALRRSRLLDNPTVAWFNEAIQTGQPIFLLGIILQEILQGVKTKAQFEQLQAKLSSFPLIEPSQIDYVYAAQLSNLCRSKGIQAATIDCLIAAVSINRNCCLVSADRDFARIAKIVPLNLRA